MNKQFCYFNGKTINYDEVVFSPHDRGFLFGDGIFETVRIYNRNPFRMEEHIDRLYTGAAVLGLVLPEQVVISRAVDELIKLNDLNNGSLRISVTGGDTHSALWPRTFSANPTILITVRETIPYKKELYEQGYKAITISFPLNELSPLAGIKSLNYLENILGRREATEANCHEGLFLNTKGELAEGTISNLFIYDGNTLLTPPVNCGILPGITRNSVIELAKSDLRLPVVEKTLYPKDLFKCKEAFLTASIMEIMPLVEVDGKIIGNGSPGEITLSLLSSYRTLASNTTLKQNNNMC